VLILGKKSKNSDDILRIHLLLFH